VDAHYIFHPSTIWVRPLCTELVRTPPPPKKNADFAMKQTNICRMSPYKRRHKKVMWQEPRSEMLINGQVDRCVVIIKVRSNVSGIAVKLWAYRMRRRRRVPLLCVVRFLQQPALQCSASNSPVLPRLGFN